TTMVAGYDTRRQRLTGILRQAGFTFADPVGAYYVFADYRHVMPDIHAFDATIALITQAGVATVPGSSFYRTTDAVVCPDTDRYLRFCFPKTEATLAEAEAKLVEWRKPGEPN
ncbi:MAG: aminotransferase class I/II-fold pyridoxal phosphate-dependent enzyme, partial [Cyanobacteria bacterium HKST-UBA06]|nr:aminotransferase class I/II-fold pyridoxal phosphate-dependent enzyme [Cyanobacteria bacterium HKST-UBA06]